MELVVQHAGGEAAAHQGGAYFASWVASSHMTGFLPGEAERVGPRLPGSRSWEDASIRVSDQVPLERSSNFPQNYTDSSHRRDWFQVTTRSLRGMLEHLTFRRNLVPTRSLQHLVTLKNPKSAWRRQPLWKGSINQTLRWRKPRWRSWT